MKPNFALILSMEGIALLQRASPGWELVGEASPESPTLGQEMKALRDAAERLAPGQATFKIVIPNEQIRYVTVPAGRADPVSRQQTVAVALDGQTPYSLDELATDSTISGANMQIAAVALETLQEADEFARGFGFTPVSFAAMPETRDYSGEPFFGTAHDVPSHITVEPDIVPIRVSGRVRAPIEAAAVPEVAPKVASETETPDTAPDATPDDAPVAFVSRRSKEPEGEAAASPAASPTPDQSPKAAPSVSPPAATAKPAPKADPAVASASSAKASAPRGAELRASRKASWERDAAKKAKAAAAAEAVPEAVADEIASPTSSPTSGLTGGPADGGLTAHRPADLTPPTTDFDTAEVPDAAPRRSALAGRTGVFGGLAATLGGAIGGLAKRRKSSGRQEVELILPQTAGISLDGTDDPHVAEPEVEAAEAVADTAPEKPAKKSRWRRSKAAAPIAVQADMADAESVEPDAAPADPTTVPTDAAEPILHAKSRKLGELSADERKKEAERLTVFGARGGATYEPSGGGARMALGVVGAVFLLGTAGWAAIFMNDGMAPLVTREETVEDPDTRSVAGAGVTDESVPPGPGDEGLEEVSPLIVTEAVEAAEQAAPEEAETATPDDAAAAPETPADGPEAEARYAATGIWQDSPDPLAAEALGTENAARDDSAGADGPPRRTEQVALAALTPDPLPTPPGPPPTPGQRFNMDDRGLVIATPEGVLTPQGVAVFAGEPPILPPTRPGEEPRAQDDAAVQPAPDTTLAPEPAPEETPETTTAEVTPDPTAEPAEEDVTVIAGQPPILPPARPAETNVPGPQVEDTTEARDSEAQSDPTGTPDASLETPTDTPDTATAEATPDPQPETDAAPRPEPRFAALRPLIRPFGTEPPTLAAAATTGPAGGASLASGAIESAVAAALVDEGADVRNSAAAGLAIVPQPEPEPRLEPAFTALRPLQRPGNIAQLAAAARVTQVPAPAVVPRVPSAASVTRQATVRNAINLRKINLIGVYGQPSDRRALVRLANGRYRKVQVGDRIDGGRVIAIGDGSLRYQKNGRNVTLDMPRG